MLHVPGGLYVHGEVSTADASAGVNVSLYEMDGTAHTLLATERLIIYDISIIAAAGGNVALTQNTDVAGSRLIKGQVSANSGFIFDYQRPLECKFGVVPKLFAAAGQIDLSLVAEIVNV